MEYARELRNKTNVCELLAATPEGNFFFDVRDDVVGWGLAHGRWEPIETAWMKTLVGPGDCVIDVGANLGWYTVAMARQVGDQGRILAFEPDPHNFALLQRNVEANQLSHRCSLQNLALLDREQVCTIERSTFNFGDHRVQFNDNQRRGENTFDEDARETAPAFAITLDLAVDREQLTDRTIRMMKVDVQGSEVLIFKGAQRTLASVEYLLTEYWPYGIGRAGGGADDFVQSLNGHFSEFCRFTAPPLTFRPIAALADDLKQFSIQYSGSDDQEMYVFRKSVGGDEHAQLPPANGRELTAPASGQNESDEGIASKPIRTHKRARSKAQDEEMFRCGGWFANTFPAVTMAARVPTWSAALAILVRRRGSFIVETGCQRKTQPDDGNGSTLIFARLAKAIRFATLATVDNSIANLNSAKELIYENSCSERVEFYLQDSVDFLTQWGWPIDFLYLDSCDYSAEGPTRSQSQEHQLREVAAAYDKLTNGAVVLLADNDLPGGGKTKLAKQFLKDRDWFCLLDLQQSLWIRSIDA